MNYFVTRLLSVLLFCLCSIVEALPESLIKASCQIAVLENENKEALKQILSQREFDLWKQVYSDAVLAQGKAAIEHAKSIDATVFLGDVKVLRSNTLALSYLVEPASAALKKLSEKSQLTYFELLEAYSLYRDHDVAVKKSKAFSLSSSTSIWWEEFPRSVIIPTNRALSTTDLDLLFGTGVYYAGALKALSIGQADGLSFTFGKFLEHDLVHKDTIEYTLRALGWTPTLENINLFARFNLRLENSIKENSSSLKEAELLRSIRFTLFHEGEASMGPLSSPDWFMGRIQSDQDYNMFLKHHSHKDFNRDYVWSGYQKLYALMREIEDLPPAITVMLQNSPLLLGK